MLSVILNRDNEAVRLIDLALRSNVDDADLLNNKAFSLAKLNQINKATKTINKIILGRVSQDLRWVVNATKGLINLRSNNIKLGRILYNESIDYFRRENELLKLSRALYFYGLEEKRLKTEYGIKYLTEAFKLAVNNKLDDLLYLFNKDKKLLKYIKKDT